MKIILVDPNRCIQCCNCQNSCKDEHCDNDWSPIAAKQGRGQFWIEIQEKQSGSGSRMKLDRVPVLCQHCEHPACMKAGKDGAVYLRKDGIVIIDPDKAKGNRAIVDACPYGVVYYNEELDLPQKCTMCAHLLDAGWEKPRCVNACPVDALVYLDEDDLTEPNLYAPLEKLHPEYGTKPRLAYVNLPKPFVAGAVYSPQEELCLDKVSLTLIGQANSKTYLAQTGMLGEFRIEGVEPGIYRLILGKDGYDTKILSRLDVREGLNVGEIRLMATPV